MQNSLWLLWAVHVTDTQQVMEMQLSLCWGWEKVGQGALCVKSGCHVTAGCVGLHLLEQPVFMLCSVYSECSCLCLKSRETPVVECR